jgi:hypothetical protein
MTQKVTTDIIANDAVTAALIAADAVDTSEIKNNAVTTAKIANGNVTPVKLSQPLTFLTSQASTTGTTVDFLGIPTWARKITLVMHAVSSDSTGHLLVQIGSGSTPETTGYNNAISFAITSAGAVNTTASTAGFPIRSAAATQAFTGALTIYGTGNNYWTAMGNFASSVGTVATSTCTGTIDTFTNVGILRVTLSTGNFDGGVMTVLYE